MLPRRALAALACVALYCLYPSINAAYTYVPFLVVICKPLLSSFTSAKFTSRGKLRFLVLCIISPLRRKKSNQRYLISRCKSEALMVAHERFGSGVIRRNIIGVSRCFPCIQRNERFCSANSFETTALVAAATISFGVRSSLIFMRCSITWLYTERHFAYRLEIFFMTRIKAGLS